MFALCSNVRLRWCPGARSKPSNAKTQKAYGQREQLRPSDFLSRLLGGRSHSRTGVIMGDVGWAVGSVVLGAVLLVWAILLFAYALVVRALERSISKEESASEASAFDLLDRAMERHPSGRHRKGEGEPHF